MGVVRGLRADLHISKMLCEGAIKSQRQERIRRIPGLVLLFFPIVSKSYDYRFTVPAFAVGRVRRAGSVGTLGRDCSPCPGMNQVSDQSSSTRGNRCSLPLVGISSALTS